MRIVKSYGTAFFFLFLFCHCLNIDIIVCVRFKSFIASTHFAIQREITDLTIVIVRAGSLSPAKCIKTQCRKVGSWEFGATHIFSFVYLIQVLIRFIVDIYFRIKTHISGPVTLWLQTDTGTDLRFY